jgi:hypothetical protein
LAHGSGFAVRGGAAHEGRSSTSIDEEFIHMKLLRLAVALLAMGTVALGGSAHAACPVFADQNTQVNQAGSSVAPVSGLAFAQYFVQVSPGAGNATLINLTISANPGFSYSNGQRGFIGTGSTLYVSYIVGPAATVGQYRDVVVQIFNVAGSLVCYDVFRVNVVRPPGWTPWLNRDAPSGNGDYETLADFDPSLVCPNPIAVECQTLTGVPWYSTGEVYTCNPTVGGACTNASQPDGACQDYQVRFYCP